jgi:hypothetical protein
MVRFVLRCAPLALLALVLAACSSNKVALQGRVLDAYTNQPIPGATLRVGDRAGITTDANGAYTTTEWGAEDTLQAEAGGYDPATLNLAEKPELKNPPQAQASPAVALDMTLRPNTLSGTITDAFTKQPLPNVLVRATDTISATTSADGSYTLQGVPETFAVTVEVADYAAAQADLQRSTTQDFELRPDVLRGAVTNTYTGSPVPNITVRAGDTTTTTGADGRYELRGIPANAEIAIEGDGFDAVRLAQPNSTTYDVALRPNILTGAVVDATTNAPLADVQLVAMAPGANVATTSVRTNETGQFRLPDVPEGSRVLALLPGYRRAETTVGRGTLASELRLEPFEAKALYVTAGLASYGLETVNQYFDTIDNTELNAMILDIKSDSATDVGVVYYDTQVPQVREAGNFGDYMPIKEILAEAKRRNIYMIARVQVMAHDNSLLQAHPDWYVQKNGRPWSAYDGMYWLDAFDERVAEYNVALAVEAAQLGFDEIQFDYIRFPSDGQLEGTVFKGPYDQENPQAMYEAIGRVCERAHKAINDAGAFFSVDVFGYAAWSPQPSIGQNLQIMGQHIDYVYPMVYPSHYAYNELGLGNPDAHPFEIVDASMKYVKDQLQGPASRVKVRPWLQDFTATWIPGTITYGPAQVRAQIDATEANRANGTNGWALWNAQAIFTVGALNPQ